MFIVQFSPVWKDKITLNLESEKYNFYVFCIGFHTKNSHHRNKQNSPEVKSNFVGVFT